MRLKRIKPAGETAVYHCVSRIVGGEKLLDDLGKEKLVQLLWPLATFCGVEVLTYCMMSNHFHLLVRIPPPAELSEEALLEKLTAFYGPQGAKTVLAQESLKKQGKIDAGIRASVEARQGDVSAFMSEFKQSFSRWYNGRNERFGTLWAERLTTVLVEDSPAALQTLAAYIDLNPVRAGLVADPKDYCHCGYAAALVGNRRIQQGLMSFLEPKDWPQAATAYRGLLFATADSANASDPQVLDPETIRAELARGGELGGGQVLRLRIRHFSDGVVLGSPEFVDRQFLRYRERFSPKRKNGARPIRGVPLPGISALRDLRVNAIG